MFARDHGEYRSDEREKGAAILAIFITTLWNRGWNGAVTVEQIEECIDQPAVRFIYLLRFCSAGSREAFHSK